ncbi:radical SAM family heme chaperone HemW [Campylobacter troglodytis]|uniref:radical SAM family heme chaperone HemW n=1 Tax=Campylobacter troglodytis TaxID=654363 RepID=UPI0011570BC5|nr:radical SAM family heme chaperone HemW [Campylobacter troglodytis]TQR60595.1 coproporphyrinogen III oxidase family protein [Campylobacter troglodytis]
MHLYLHVPFCFSKCSYCAFTSLKANDSLQEAYFKALLEDMSFHFDKLELKGIKSLFIGGGTPSVVNFKLYEPLFKFLSTYLDDNCECSIEANPHSSNLEWLEHMKAFGINRLSFGAQSFDEKKLGFLGRAHSQKDIFKSLENATKAGFSKINIDLIYDTKLDSKKMLEFELENVAILTKMGLSHLSAYHLTLEKNTAFWGHLNYKKNAPNLMRFFIRGIENLGFFQYELSNFTKNEPCKHNLAYWQGRNYLGCGLSAVSFYDKSRFYTHKDLKSYIKEPHFRHIESLSEEDLLLEHLFLGLRSVVGIEEERLNEGQRQRAFLLVKSGKLRYDTHLKGFFKNELKDISKNEFATKLKANFHLKNSQKPRFFSTNFLLADELTLFLAS